MKLILLSGGSGKRLWPLSNNSRSKQFLKILHNEDNVQESMIQRIWRQIHAIGLEDSTYITTSKAQVDIIQNQLGSELPLIVEPVRQDTFSAIALAAVYLYSVHHVSLDETICILPVDAYVEDSFFESLSELENVAKNSNALITLMGVQPTFPSEQFGYIVPVPNNLAQPSSYIRVSHFLEKPDQDTAKKLIDQNALWNCGVFAFKLQFLIQYLSDIGMPIQYENLLNQYIHLPKKSFDYEIVEKCDHIVAIPYTGTWRDLGTWGTLTEIMNTQLIGKATLGQSAINTHIINELELPVIVTGICDSIIVTSPDGILIADKMESGEIKKFVKSYEERPMYEEKRWGCYRVIDYQKLEDGNEVLTKRIKIVAGRNLSYQMHNKRQEVWTIISGEGELIIDGVFQNVKPGDVIQIPAKTKHGARAISDLEFIEVQLGSELIEEDIVRIHMTWEEIEHNFR